MAADAELLDAEELLSLATRAIDRRDPEAALVYLKRLLELSPDDGHALYLLGAVHAEIGMVERAIAEMTRAVEREPGLAIARFQLGMLLVLDGPPERAYEAWRPLAALGPDDPLVLFTRGMEHFIHDRYAEAVADLSRGIEQNADNPALNRDMAKILQGAQEALAEEGGAASDRGATGPAGRRLLDAYRRGDPDGSD